MKNTLQEKTERNYGIDLLRVVSMLYVVILHTLGFGGVSAAVEFGSGQHLAAYFLEMWCYCAVNIFGMISGYVGYTEKYKKFSYAGFLVTWLQVVVYCAGLTLAGYLISPELITQKHILSIFFPVTTSVYWYFTAYAGLVIVIPFLNAAVRGLEEKTLKMLLAGLLVFLIIEWEKDIWGMDWGYSACWLAVLYLIGAIIKKCGIGRDLSLWKAIAGLIICTALPLVWQIYGTDFRIIGFSYTKDLISRNTMPTYVIAAMLHIIVFSKLKTGAINRLIAFAAPGAFAIYLVNIHDVTFQLFLYDRYRNLAYSSPVGLVAKVVAVSAGFCIAVLLIDFVRRKLFQLLRVKQASQMLSGCVEKMLARMVR